MSRRAERFADGPVGAARAGTEDIEVRPDCPCPKRTCTLHGLCTDCRSKHGRKGQAPRCER